jgi:hypothetical protein
MSIDKLMSAARAAGFAMIPPDDATDNEPEMISLPVSTRSAGADMMNSTRRYLVRARVHLRAASRNTGVREYVTHWFQPRAAA